MGNTIHILYIQLSIYLSTQLLGYLSIYVDINSYQARARCSNSTIIVQHDKLICLDVNLNTYSYCNIIEVSPEKKMIIK